MSFEMNKAFNFNPSIEISPGVFFCEKKNLYWSKGRVYDELSARHNGIVGVGAKLREVIKLCQKNSTNL